MELAEATDAIYREERSNSGLRLIPSELSSGPWNLEHQHGGAVSGLLARALMQFDAPVSMRLTRMTLEMFRGVPIRPLRIEPEIIRAGRRIQSLEVRLFDEETLVARATGLRIRIDEGVSVHFLREPRSDWIGIRGTTLRAGDGIGQSHARIYDLEGLVATVDASLLMSRR